MDKLHLTRHIFFLVLFKALPVYVFSQSIGIGTTQPHTSAALDITSTTKGLLIPRMTITDITAISNPAKGLMVYDSVQNILMVNMGSPATPNWQNIVANNSWGIAGNANTDTAVNFIGTTDSIPLFFRINNQPAGRLDSATNNRNGNYLGNSFLGYGAGKYTSTGIANTAFGYQALDSNIAGNYNTALGMQALHTGVYIHDQSVGNDNTAAGYQAIYHQDNFNTVDATATGYQALFRGNSSATAVGYQAGLNFAGDVSVGSLANSGIGARSSGIGYAAGFSTNLNLVSINAEGYQAMYNNITGNYDVGFGAGALYSINDPGAYNTAMGTYSLINTTQSQGNVALGYNAGHTYDNGYYNCFIGAETDANGPDYYNTIALGHGTLVTAPNMMRVGNGATTSVGGPVKWSVISDGRVKNNIQENVPGLAFINQLKPITYTIDLSAIDQIVQSSAASKNTATHSTAAALPVKAIEKPVPPQLAAAFKAKEQIVYSGFSAQAVEQAARSLGYSFSGVDAAKSDKDLYGLRYANFVVPLVKAVQELAIQYNDLKKENVRLMQQKDQAMQQLTELEKKAN